MSEVTISKEDYVDLLVASEKLSRLECGGVDNWEWYGESLNPKGDESISLFAAKLKLEHGVELNRFDLAVLEEEEEPKQEEEEDDE